MKKKSLLSLVFIFVVSISCKKDDVIIPDLVVSGTLAPDPNIFYTSTVLSGANEVPAVTSTATGDVSGTYNKTTKILNLNVTYSGITPTAWHIHKAAVGVAGGVSINFGAAFSTPYNYISPAGITDAQEADLLGGLNYFNIHSAKSPSGEIRGQLAAVNSKARGTVSGSFNPTTKILTVTINYSDMTPTAWHIHKGDVGVAGPVVVDLGTTFASPTTFTSTALTADQEADLKAGLYYVNIHSKIAPSGEIRGQLSAK
jgi:CHRD domain